MDISALSTGVSSATALSNLILVTPQSTIGYQPQNTPSYLVDTTTAVPPALLFNYEGEQTVTLQSDITDHYTENNSPIQDQIALKPEVVTTHGFVGELNDIFPAAPISIQTIQQKLVTVAAYTPELSISALIALATAQQLYQVAKNAASAAVSTWASIDSAVSGSSTGQQSVINGAGLSNGNSSIVNKLTQTQQQIYFAQFYGYWRNRTLFTIQTPWAVFQDMAIMSLRAVQDDSTRMITDFEITFKLMRFASTLTDSSTFDSANAQGRLSDQSADTTNLGTHTLTPDTSTTFSQSLTQVA